ncbi:hypothetical protein B0T16DRAFT_451941 [Cercophora newfieldiana]|uniref:ABM domain-containing protein n=1 Tax=Cercophora newfieldiana TaxID=92897 RepID=A0AA40CZL3_9PEZI|nr:hypothetical protein B0T16DRAFT_451941 [Cercophora newfieldiana]
MSQPSFATFNLVRVDNDAEKQGLIDKIKNTPGHQQVFFGRKKEDDSIGVVCSLWASLDAAQVYTSQIPSADTQEAALFEIGPDYDPLVPLTAPCTEVFTAHGTEEGFVGNAKRFAQAVDGEKGSL